jgi:hypothetical protein
VITVQVFDKSTGRAWKGAEVTAYPNAAGGGHRAFTDDGGDAHFAALSPGHYEVSVEGASVFKGRIEGRAVVYR